MTKRENKRPAEPKFGSATSNEIYLSVGLALSFWESSEDLLAQLFEAVCQGNEKVGFETYCIAPRQSRDRMLLSALKYYSNEVSPEEIKIIQTAIKELTRLASLRNEIAHGYVSNQTVTENGVKVMEGNYLVSSIDPSGNTVPRGFNLKYAHTAAEIDEWRDKVRIYRGTIIDCYHALIDRRNGGRRD